MKRLIWLPVAGFLLVAGAAVAAAAPSVVSITPAPASEASDTSSTLRLGPAGLLEEVLAELVESGVITQEQHDAIVDAVEVRADERRAEIEAGIAEIRATWQQVRGFLEDEVITQDEIGQLPEGNPLREAFDSIADDGQITLDQLRELGPGLGRGFAHGFGRGSVDGPGHGHGGPWTWFDSSDSDTDSEFDADATSD